MKGNKSSKKMRRNTIRDTLMCPHLRQMEVSFMEELLPDSKNSKPPISKIPERAKFCKTLPALERPNLKKYLVTGYVKENRCGS